MDDVGVLRTLPIVTAVARTLHRSSAMRIRMLEYPENESHPMAGGLS